jgi:hypothetical protein
MMYHQDTWRPNAYACESRNASTSTVRHGGTRIPCLLTCVTPAHRRLSVFRNTIKARLSAGGSFSPNSCLMIAPSAAIAAMDAMTAATLPHVLAKQKARLTIEHAHKRAIPLQLHLLADPAGRQTGFPGSSRCARLSISRWPEHWEFAAPQQLGGSRAKPLLVRGRPLSRQRSHRASRCWCRKRP